MQSPLWSLDESHDSRSKKSFKGQVQQSSALIQAKLPLFHTWVSGKQRIQRHWANWLFLFVGWGVFFLFPFFFFFNLLQKKAEQLFRVEEIVRKGGGHPLVIQGWADLPLPSFHLPPICLILWIVHLRSAFQSERRTLQKVMGKQSEWKLFWKLNYSVYS